MADIDIERKHNLAIAEVRQRMTDIEQKLSERFGVNIQWDGNIGIIAGRGISGTIELKPTSVCVRLKLGIALGFVAGKIRDGMERQLDKTLLV